MEKDEQKWGGLIGSMQTCTHLPRTLNRRLAQVIHEWSVISQIKQDTPSQKAGVKLPIALDD